MFGTFSFVRLLTFVLGAIGLCWGATVIPASGTIDNLRYFETQLLRSKTFTRKDLSELLSVASDAVGDCDTDAQEAMLLIEVRLANFALQAGDVVDYDNRLASAERRARDLLACAPRRSFVWLLAFSFEVLHGRLNQHAFDLLTMSYETSPNEGWIAIRRNIVTAPLVLIAPEPIKDKILSEFEQVSTYYPQEAARSYQSVNEQAQTLLRQRVGQLGQQSQKEFWEATTKR